jgi:hypothetical protein
MRRLSMLLIVLGTLIACGEAQGAGWVFHEPEMIDPGAGLTGVACPAKNLCIAVDRRGDVLTSRSPGAAPSSWMSATIDPPGTRLTGVACASSTLCVAVDGQGSAFVSGDPSAGAAGWRASAIDPGHALTGIACPTASLCVATDDDASVVTSTDPTGGASAWTRSTIDNQVSESCVKYGDEPCPPASFSGVSCPSSALCVAADDFGYAWTSVSPGAGASSWHPAGADPFAAYGGAATSLSCPTAGLCIMVGGGESGEISIAKDPIARAPTDPWRPHDVAVLLDWIGCPLTTLCVTDANIASFDPASGPLSFRSMAIDTRGTLDGISCPSATVCVAVDDRGQRVLATPAVAPFAGHPHAFGAARIGATLTATSGRWRGSTPIEYTYRWQRCEPRCVAITGATSSRYRIVARDLAARLRVLVTASNVGGAGRRAASALTAPIRRPRRP